MVSRLYSGLAIGVLISLCNHANAGGLDVPLSFKVGLGQSSFKNSLDATALTSKGYSVNSYSQDKVNDETYSLGLLYRFSPKFNLEINWLDLGKVDSSLDIGLPTGVTAAQAAQDIVEASPQQVGGTVITLGVNYIYPMYNRLNFIAGAGLLAGEDDHSVTINGQAFDIDNTVTEPYAKLGLAWKISKRFSITAQTERYFFDSAIDRYEVGLSYDFGL